VWTVGMLGVGVGVVALVRSRTGHRWHRRLGALALGLLATAGVTGWTTAHTGRSLQNLSDVLVVRIFPFPGRVAWFAAHGMPEARIIDRLAADTRPLTPGAATVVDVVPSSPTWAPLERWISSRGETTFALWLLTHPGYVITEPFARPERAFNYAGGDLTFYAAPGRVDSPLTAVLWPAWWWLLPMTAVGLAGAVVTGSWRERGPWVVVGLGVVGVVSMLVAWQGDGQEVARHTVEGFAEVRVCVLILAIVGVLGGPGRRDRSSAGGA
jgi:hypothetical protein